MNETGTVDAGLVRAWLAARSLSRGLPAPVDDRGGWRVDTRQPEEERRYLFVTPGSGLAGLGHEIDEPRVALKLCGQPDALMASLPPRWALSSANCAMVRDIQPDLPPILPAGYRLASDSDGEAGRAVILDASGALAAEGYSIEAAGVFIYDRIRTEPDHRRRGLGCAIIAALGRFRRSSRSQEILTATEEGKALYRTIGWRIYSPYSTAIIPPI